MPKTWTLKIDNYFAANPRCIIATAIVDTFPTDLPLEPNVREPNRKSSTHRQILDSISTQPEKFYERHSGIVLSASKVKSGKGKLELEILEACEGGSDGIINGGHTILAFETARGYKYDLSKARVKVTIHVGLREEEAKDIALASNTTAPVDSRSKTNAKGDYDFLKNYIAQLELDSDSKLRVAYYQNQTGVPKNGHCSVMHIFRLINCFDRNRYNPDSSTLTKHPTGDHVARVITVSEKARLSKLLHLLPQALWIEQRLYSIIQEHISNPKRKGNCDLASINTSKNTLLPDCKYSFGFSAPADLSLPLVASYRVFLDLDYNWLIPFDEFADQFATHVWNIYFRKYLINQKTAGNTVGAKICRDRDVWEQMYIIAQSYLNKHLMNMVDKSSKSKTEEKFTLTAR
jgi:hypothetical protein